MADQHPPGTPEQFVAPAAPTPEELARLPHDNQGLKINVIVWALYIFASLFLALRIYCKFVRKRGLWWDDYILIAAWMCLTVETSILTAMVKLGFGVHMWDFNMQNMPQLLLYIDIAGSFSPTAVIWSKTSFAVTLLRLTEGKTKKFVWFLIVSGNIFIGLSSLFLWVQCKPLEKAWSPFVPGVCWAPDVLMKYNIFSGAYSAAMDFTLALLPWTIVWNLRMRRTDKIGVAIAMSMGIFAGITGVIKTAKFPAMLSHDFADAVDLWLWGNAETAVTIVAASIPMLRALVHDGSTQRHDMSLEKISDPSRQMSNAGTVATSGSAGKEQTPSSLEARTNSDNDVSAHDG